MLMSAQGCEESLQERTARTRLHDGSVPVLVWLLTAFSALTALLCGYECGGAPGALLQLRGQMGVSLAWAEALVCVAPGAAALSGPAGALVNGLFGRRLALLLSSLTYCVGGVMLSAAHSKEVLLLARLIVGVALGISSMTAPVYIAEVSPPRLRGQLVTFNMLFFSGGQLIACLVVGAFSYLQSSGWRYVLGLSVVPAVIQFLAFLFLPESPRWLIQKGLTQRARRSLTQIRGNQNIDEEYDGIKSSIEEEEKDAEGGGPVIWHMLCYPPTRRALAVGCGLHMFQQLAGINTVIYYSSPILQMSGVRDEHLATWLTLIPAFTNFLFAVLGLWLVERLGRRKLTLGSIAGTTLSLALLAIGLLLSAQNSPAVTLHPADPSSLNSTCIHYRSCEPCVQDPGCGFCYHENSTMVFASSCVPVSHTSTKAAVWGRCSNSSQTKDGTYWAFNYCPSSYSWIVLLGLLLYMAFYAPGLGPMPCTVNSEIYPMWARSTGNAYSAGVNWACGVLVWLSFIHLAQYLTYYGMFFLYTSFALLGFVFALGCLPETRGRRLEEMESLFENRLCTCGVSDADEDRQVEYIRVKGSNYHLSDNDTSDVD